MNQIWQSAENDPSLRFYAILDSARDTRIYSKLAESEIECASLFRGDQARELSDVAPYVVPVYRDEPFTTWLFENGWGNNWGITVETRADLSGIKRHFQRSLIVYDNKGRPLYFRFYDPRVLRIYLPSCNESELETLFGPVRAFYVEGEDPGILLHYSFAGGKLVERRVQL